MLGPGDLMRRPGTTLGSVAAIAGLVWLCRWLGFGEGVLLAATPASGVALVATLTLRWRGGVVVFTGFALGDLLSGLGPVEAAVDGAAHGAAALAAWSAMRALARRGGTATRMLEWLVFLAGVALFSLVVASVLGLAASLGLLGAEVSPLRLAALAWIFQPLGLATCAAALATLAEVDQVRDDPGPAIGIAAFGLVLLAALGILLDFGGHLDPSAVTLLLAAPFCLWIAMQRRSFDGAVISLAAVNVALCILLLHFGGAVTAPGFVATVAFLNLLVLTCQLVHAVNRDRLDAIDETLAHRRDLERRVDERTAMLTEMTERALAADAAKTRLLATVAHEVRTPLSGIIGMTSVVLRDDLGESARRNVGLMRSSGLHLLSVIDRILEYSRLEQGTYREPEDGPFDLGALLAEIVEEARFTARPGAVALRVTLAPGLERARRGDRPALRQIVTNLVANAVRFTDAGLITVRARALAGDTLRIEVEDTGVGVLPSAQERIFQPFEQGEDGTRRPGGAGLGLAISAEMVRRMGGRIGLHSAIGEGSIFWIEAPLPVDHEAPPPAPPVPRPELRLVGAR